MTWPTAKEIVNDTLILVGLIETDLDDPFASEDQAIRQICRLLKVAGREIVREREWTHLTREYTFPTVANQREYALPADFRAMISQTGWNRSATRALGGPLSPEQWQAAKGWRTTFTGRVLFRPANGALWLLEDALAGDQTIAFEYRTNWWAAPTGGAVPSKEFPTASQDIVFLDAHLAILRLALEWKKAKSLDTLSAQQDYDDAFRKCASADAPKRVLSLGGPRPAMKFIDGDNVPDTVPVP